MSLPVITVEQMRRWEAATWETGKTEAEVIAQVGEIVARRALELTQPGDSILLLSGKGHNGDDVRAMANHLQERDVSLLSITDPAKTLSNLATALEPRPALVVDGLFGIGLNRVLDADWMQVISQLNANRLRVLSVDVPSGVDAATGEIQGAAIRAEETLTLGAPKTGLLHSAAADYVGRLTVAPEIGLVPRTATSELQLGQAEDFIGFPPPRPAGGHKSTFGHVGIMAGSLGYHGAAVLAARGATRAQPGLVTLLTPEEVFVPVASQLQSVMVQPLVPGEITIKSITTLLVGPGMASDRLPDDLKTTADSMWHESSVPMVVDASALDWLTAGAVPEKSIRVITPHPGEAARLLGGGRVTMCKSGKDRTSMGVTLEHGRLLQGYHGLHAAHLSEAVQAMRRRGVRRENVRLNTGKRLYAFNFLQQNFLPEAYRPPEGSAKGGKA